MSRLRDARIRSKLGLILVIPLVAVVALAAARLADSGQQAIAAEEVRSLTEVSVEASKVSNFVQLERIEAARLLGDPDTDLGPFNTRSAQTDTAIADYRAARSVLGDPPDAVREHLNTIDSQLTELDTIRQQILGDTPVTVSAAVVRYGVILTDVLAYLETVDEVTDDPDLAQQIRAVAAMSKAKALAAEAEAVALVALSDGELTEEELTTFLATQTGQQEAFLDFSQNATLDQQAVANRAITGGSVIYADLATTDLLRAAGRGEQLDPAAAVNSFRGISTAIRWAEEQIQEDLLANATTLRDDVFQQVLIESVVALLALIVAITLAVLLARMLAKSLGRLRQHALAVADRELPETVARLSDPRTLGENTPAQLAAQVREPAALRSRDEIGQVAQAFAVVHRAAVRVAAEQAALRTSVSAMFLNLARRSQTLVDRMISELDDIERSEEDPKRLARMFTLDHLATRMRRNDENLLTLAGADSSPPRSDDALVVDALRAAQSEVEHYDRIEFGTVDSDVSVVPGAVNDVVRLVAELFDNATRFSPPDSPVVCEARRLGDQMILQIEDRGVGMSADQVERVNAWLATPPAVEVTTFRKMGLAVVARLANRHGIRVELRCNPNFGTVAYVALPRTILILPPSRIRSIEALPAASPAPPAPARQLGHSPARPADVAHHAAPRRPGKNSDHAGSGVTGAPVAGRAPHELTAASAAPAAAAAGYRTVDSTTELPIFNAATEGWFAAGHSPLDLVTGPQHRGSSVQDVTGAPAASAPDSFDDGDQWHTAADPGWRAAAAAAAPATGGATPSGLPTRVPQAQLVPGGVQATAAVAPQQRRSPEEIRGLLTAYHRGVQRGREGHTR